MYLSNLYLLKSLVFLWRNISRAVFLLHSRNRQERTNNLKRWALTWLLGASLLTEAYPDLWVVLLVQNPVQLVDWRAKKAGFSGKSISVSTEEKAETFSQKNDCSKGGWINRIVSDKQWQREANFNDFIIGMRFHYREERYRSKISSSSILDKKRLKLISFSLLLFSVAIEYRTG